MSANDHIVGGVGGEEVTGSVDGGDAPESSAAPAAGDAADASSASAESADAVDNGALAPANDPSVPPTNGAHPLLALSNEILQTIVAQVDVVSVYSFRLSGKELRRRLDAPPPMSAGEYVQFQRQFEAHASRKPRSLYCPSCNTFKNPTASKTSFTDAQAVRNLNGKRSCIECAVASGHFNRRDVVIKKKHFFLCGGCRTLLTLDKEETAVTNVVFRTDFPYHDDMNGRAAEITIDSGGKRWCKTCRAAFGSLGASGAVKVRTR